MTIGADIIAEARTWIGTPWVHQGACKAVGTDCLGLIAGVGLALNLLGSRRWRSDPRTLGYDRMPRERTIIECCQDYLDRVRGDTRAGDILLLRVATPSPQHFAFLVCHDPMTVIHAYAGIGRVCESVFNAQWQARIVRTYRFRGLDA